MQGWICEIPETVFTSLTDLTLQTLLQLSLLLSSVPFKSPVCAINREASSPCSWCAVVLAINTGLWAAVKTAFWTARLGVDRICTVCLCLTQRGLVVEDYSLFVSCVCWHHRWDCSQITFHTFEIAYTLIHDISGYKRGEEIWNLFYSLRILLWEFGKSTSQMAIWSNLNIGSNRPIFCC